MRIEFTPIAGEKPGVIAGLLGESYSELLKSDPHWESEIANWEQYDHDVFACPDTVGNSLFLTRLSGRIVGFASWDPRQRPAYGTIGHNCILPEFRGKGLGKLQIGQVLLRLQALGIRTARVSTNSLSFFVPAQRMYVACGFRELRRIPWAVNPATTMIEFEKVLLAGSIDDR